MQAGGEQTLNLARNRRHAQRKNNRIFNSWTIRSDFLNWTKVSKASNSCPLANQSKPQIWSDVPFYFSASAIPWVLLLVVRPPPCCTLPSAWEMARFGHMLPLHNLVNFLIPQAISDTNTWLVNSIGSIFTHMQQKNVHAHVKKFGDAYIEHIYTISARGKIRKNTTFFLTSSDLPF